jgi:hypothetical protein
MENLSHTSGKHGSLEALNNDGLLSVRQTLLCHADDIHYKNATLKK